MEQIKIGTCVPGYNAPKVIEGMQGLGFESVAINFHMEFNGVRLEELAKQVMGILEKSGMTVSALGYYCNPLENAQDAANLAHVIDCARLFNTPVVSTFAGGLTGRPVEECLPVFGKIFGELAKRAADRGIKIAFENCGMGGSWNSVTCNIAFNHNAWERMFNAVHDENLGLEWEPAHQMWQLIDPVQQLRKWAPKIIHVHGKDANIHMDVLRTDGVFGEYCWHRTPGFGDCDWRQLISILRFNGFGGAIDIEGYHDPVYKDEWELTGQLHGLSYLKMCRGGTFAPAQLY